jgi:ornithine carbamoyltransferase
MGDLGVSFQEIKDRAAAVSFSMKGLREREAFVSVPRHAEYLLGNTRSSITLNISDLQHEQKEQLKRLLARLSRYGDRIHIRIDEASRRIIAIDSSVFNLVLAKD